MDIRSYDFEFNLLAVAPRVISSVWNLKYNSVGTYEGHFALSDSVAKVLLENKYVVLCEGDRQAICTGKIAENDLLICGRSINWILTRRIVLPFNTKEFFDSEFKSPREIAVYLLNNTYKTPTAYDENGDATSEIDNDSVVESFVIPADVGGEKMSRFFWRNSANTLSEVIIDLCELADCGHRVVFDVTKKQWVFEFIDGKELDTIVSESNKNAHAVKLIEDIDNYASAGFYEYSSGENEALTYSYIPKDEKKGIYKWECILSSSGRSKATSDLQKKYIKTYAQLKFKGLEYGIDYSMGDIMRVQVDYGIYRKDIKQRIVGVCIKNASGTYSQDITFALV